MDPSNRLRVPIWPAAVTERFSTRAVKLRRTQYVWELPAVKNLFEPSDGEAFERLFLVSEQHGGFLTKRFSCCVLVRLFSSFMQMLLDGRV